MKDFFRLFPLVLTVFAAHALAHIGLPGATGAVLLGLPVSLGIGVFALGGALVIGQLLFRKNFIQSLMGAQIELPAPVWLKLNWAWTAFFAAMGGLNIWVAYNFDTDTWVNFKLFGGMGLMLVFVLAQGMLLSRYIEEEPK